MSHPSEGGFGALSGEACAWDADPIAGMVGEITDPPRNPGFFPRFSLIKPENLLAASKKVSVKKRLLRSLSSLLGKHDPLRMFLVISVSHQPVCKTSNDNLNMHKHAFSMLLVYFLSKPPIRSNKDIQLILISIYIYVIIIRIIC